MNLPITIHTHTSKGPFRYNTCLYSALVNQSYRNITFLTAVIVLLITAVSYERSFFDELSNTQISRQAQRYISTKSIAIEKYIELLSDAVEKNEDLWDIPLSNNYLVFVSSSAKQVYWNSNRISPSNIPFSKQLICHKIDNAWFLYKSTIAANKRIDVLVNIKNDYPIRNEFFSNENTEQSELSQYSISELPRPGYDAAYDTNNRPLFYFAKTELNEHNRRHSLLASVIYFVLFLIILVYLSHWHKKSYINLLSVSSFGLIFLLLVRYFHFISIFSRTTLFDPQLYGATGLFSTIGMMILGGLFWLIFSFSLAQSIKYFKPKPRQAFAMVLLLMLLFFVFTLRYIDILQHTNINLQIFKILLITQDTFWVYAILLMFIGGWGRLCTAVVNTFKFHKGAFLYPLLSLIVLTPFVIKYPVALLSVAFFINFTLFMLRRKQMAQYALLHLLGASMLLAFVVTYITETESIKRSDLQKSLLISTMPTTLLQERDFQVEEKLLDIWNAMQDDINLQNMPLMMFNTPDFYTSYFKENYFDDGLKDYELQVVICNPDNYLQIEGSSASPNCYSYFENMLKDLGERIKNTNFYWQHNDNGRVSYFCWLKIAEGTLLETSIFIDLESQILTEGQGYPELIKDKSKNKHYLPEEISFARYANHKLITSSGDFRYPPTDKWMPTLEKNSTSINFNHQTHLCYRISDDSCVVLSEPRRTLLFPLYAFIYTFLMIYLSFIVVYLLTHQNSITLKRTISNDIRFTIYGVLLLSLLMVGSASILFPINIYKKNQQTAINEKSESFLSALSRELQAVSQIHSVSPALLQNELLSLSNTLYKDVHLYDLDGKLYASSRPQLFNLKLQGNIMSATAFRAFKYDNAMNQVFTETIGNNTYTSCYFMLSNGAEEPLGFVNVPFFNSQQDLKKSISDYLVLLLNIFLLLVILVIILTYFSVTAITKPLLIIQDGLSRMKLGSNEKISYAREDEIGSLVDKYNVMVDELNASVKQLAQNERDVAWQRMARQIAHEIKNPLTPMKLSIQHLARTKTVSPEAFDAFFNKTATTLVEQIDNLSNIATSFSTFAKISDGKPERLHINERINSIVTLFEQSGSNIKFVPSPEDIQVSMDKDHFIQIFNNLIKNALQSVPEERVPEIIITTLASSETATIRVKDNGTGIEKDTQSKIFEPNFTTKNSGMGLGLAISQKMTNNAQGEIRFETSETEGTTFIVDLPRLIN